MKYKTQEFQTFCKTVSSQQTSNFHTSVVRSDQARSYHGRHNNT